jgi:hypothetical protein
VDRYSRQAAVYALALEAALHEAVTRCVFVFAREPEAVERDVADLASSISDVRRLLGQETVAV